MPTRAFTWLSVPTGLLYLWLCYQLLFTPAEMLHGFGVAADAPTLNLARRISVLMLGFAILVLAGCRLPRSTGRAVVATAVAANMAGFSIHSFWGAAHGILTDPAIPVIGCVEALIALAYAGCAIADFVTLRRDGTAR